MKIDTLERRKKKKENLFLIKTKRSFRYFSTPTMPIKRQLKMFVKTNQLSDFLFERGIFI